MMNPVQKSILLTKPVKMPKGLIYKQPRKNKYLLIETKTKHVIGNMNAFNIQGDEFRANFYKVGPDKNIFHISSLHINNNRRGEGWGKFFIDFAKKESYRQGCEGRLYVVAYDYEKPPQIFYKKQGFVAKNPQTDQKLDDYIKSGTRPYSFPATDMYLPINMIEKNKVPRIVPWLKKNFLQTIKDFFRKHFSCFFSI